MRSTHDFKIKIDSLDKNKDQVNVNPIFVPECVVCLEDCTINNIVKCLNCRQRVVCYSCVGILIQNTKRDVLCPLCRAAWLQVDRSKGEFKIISNNIMLQICIQVKQPTVTPSTSGESNNDSISGHEPHESCWLACCNLTWIMSDCIMCVCIAVILITLAIISYT